LHSATLGLTKATTLTLGSNLENLDASDTGATLLNLTGNGLSNILTGNDAHNVLTGGKGADVFAFSNLPADPASADLVTDFVHGTDHLAFDQAVFNTLSFNIDGSLGVGQFTTGIADSATRLIYDTSAGNLYYDVDGNGSTAAVLLVTLGVSLHPTLTEADILHV
jgi:Ca2+-binding RTX toxin-like protein